jgi:hypothetical protein
MVAFGIASAFRQDPRYFRSQVPGVWNRIRHATAHTFLTRTDDNRRTFSTWRIGSSYAAAFISNTWRPDRTATNRRALERGTISLGFDVAANIFKEFWPDIRKKILP